MEVTAEAPRPRLYDASDVAWKAQPNLAPPKVTIDPLDPLRSFEAGDKQVTTDLKLWMTFPEADRAQRLVDMETKFQNDLAIAMRSSDAHEAIAIREQRWRDYAYIAWREAKPEMLDGNGKVGAKGSKVIALKAIELAFTQLQPRDKREQAAK